MRRDDDIRQPDDRGTIIESLDALQHAKGSTLSESRPVTLREPVSPDSGSEGHEQPFRPAFRPPVPKLLVLDDGALDAGEPIRLRDAVVIIGRNEGTIRLPHDPLVSSKHAELIREGRVAPWKWILKDAGSANGTFVRCSSTILRTDRILILGSRRLRFRPALSMAQPSGGAPYAGTVPVDTRSINADPWPALVECSSANTPLEISLTKESLSVGRPGHGNDLELDDPLIAKHHATITRNALGEWHIEAMPSQNGVWVQISAIKLSPVCRFQCGEQRFLFVM